LGTWCGRGYAIPSDTGTSSRAQAPAAPARAIFCSCGVEGRWNFRSRGRPLASHDRCICVGIALSHVWRLPLPSKYCPGFHPIARGALLATSRSYLSVYSHALPLSGRGCIRKPAACRASAVTENTGVATTQASCAIGGTLQCSPLLHAREPCAAPNIA